MQVSALLVEAGEKPQIQIQVTALLHLPACELCQIPLGVKACLSDHHVKHTPLHSFLAAHLG